MILNCCEFKLQFIKYQYTLNENLLILFRFSAIINTVLTQIIALEFRVIDEYIGISALLKKTIDYIYIIDIIQTLDYIFLNFS